MEAESNTGADLSILLPAIAGVLYLLGVGAQASLTVARPIKRLSDVAQKLADGDVAIEIPHANRGDEIGEMSRSVRFFRSKMLALNQLQEAQDGARQFLAQGMFRRDRDIVNTVTEIATDAIEQMSTLTGEMETTAREQQTIARETAKHSSNANQAADGASRNVQTVAAAEELDSSIAEVNNQVAQSTRIARDAARAFFAIVESRKSAIALRSHADLVPGCLRWHANSSSVDVRPDRRNRSSDQ